MADCVFCAIMARTVPSSVVYQDETCTAFMDIQPVNPGHVLVTPNVHVDSLADLDPETGRHMFEVAHLFLADGAAAGQDVFHVHLHVIPRYRGDGFGFRFGPDYGRRPPRSELDSQAAQMRSALEGP